MLTWDVIVLNGYLLLNLHICGYLIYCAYRKWTPNKTWFVIPFVLIAIVWAISIHTVTAFLYCGLGGRPLWNSAMLAPRFLASAFVSGPAFIILTMFVLKKLGGVRLSQRPVRTLVGIVRVTILINLLMLVSEMFTEFYAGGAHTASARYLFFGLHGHDGLVPWIWTAIALNVVAAVLFLRPDAPSRWSLLVPACGMAFVGIWIEKGMGLIVPGFIPSTLHQIVEYSPSPVEWKVTAGIWAFGLMVFTVAVKIAIAVLSGASSLGDPAHSSPGGDV